MVFYFSLQQSSGDWRLFIGISECTVLSVSNKSTFSVDIHYINSSAIAHHNAHKDLGSTLRQNLSLIEHVSNTVSKAGQQVSILFRNMTSWSCDTMRRAFITYVWPLVEYNSTGWNYVRQIYDIDLTDDAQRNFSKYNVVVISAHTERMITLNLETLELRRLRVDPIFNYKVCNHLTPFDSNVAFTTCLLPPNLRRNSPTIQAPIRMSNKLFSLYFL